MRFALIDFNNIVQRAKHVIRDYDSPEEYVGMTMTIVFNSMRKAFNKFKSDHAVICMDSYSWRKEVYAEYKGNRAAKEKNATDEEIEKHEYTKRVMRDVGEFLREYTNVTVLEEYGLEADDFIARWIQRHAGAEFDHVIISADGDFKQLVCDNVELYNPLSDTMYTRFGVFYQDGKRAGKDIETAERYGETWKVKLDKKTGEPEIFNPEWELFQKCIRGDVSDNIKAAYPRVSTTKMRRAFDARVTNPMEWNNFLNETWGPENVLVRDRYEDNKLLIDLTNQPEDVIACMDEVINKAVKKETRRMVSVYFQKFCGKYRLDRILQSSSVIVPFLSLPYKG